MTNTFLGAAALLLGLSTVSMNATAQTYVCFETSAGDICMDLLPEVAPATVANFLNYVHGGDYANTLVHRSEPGFVIQGGGYVLNGNAVGTVQADAPVRNEFARSNVRGTVGMAKLGSDPNSATSQWFFNLADNIGLNSTNGGFTVFAEVVTGMNIVDRIAGYATFNLSGSLGDAFARTPATAPAGTTSLDIAELILVRRAYSTNVLPYHCSAAGIGDTLTEFCGTTLSFPVLVNGALYEATLRHLPERPGLVFAVDRSSLKPLADNGSARAVFNNNQLVIPSVRIGGGVVENVTLQLTNQAALEFTVQTYSRR